jgi:hypothetical protein
MVNRELLNLVMADMVVGISQNIIPQDEIFIAYKELYETAGIPEGFEHMYPSYLIRTLMSITGKLYATHTDLEIEDLVGAVLSKINTLIRPINVSFCKGFILAKHSTKRQSLSIESKIEKLQNCIVNGVPVNEPILELEYYSMMLSVYLTNVTNYLSEIQITAAKVRELVLTKDQLPTEIF